MLRETYEELTNLQLLRDVVWPEIERRETEGLLDFDYYERVQGCRSYLCILGSCCDHPIMRARGFALDRDRFGSIVIVTPRFRGAEIQDRPTGESTPGFGLTSVEHRALFGNSAQGGTLAQRKCLLNSLIVEREARLGISAQP